MTRIGIRPFRCYSNSTKLESHRSFVRFICLLLLFVVVVISSQKSNSQTRPRRVGDRGTSEASAPSSTSTSPSQPPVLRGANSNGQSPGTQSRQPAANRPEEVGAGDIVRVNTTLVTIPVSVMDRNGKYIPNLRKEDFRL